MAEAGKDMSGWDKVDETEGFQEQLGSKRYRDDSGAATASADDQGMLTMPDESLAADDSSSFREQLPQDDAAHTADSAMMASDLEAATRDQHEDESD